MYKNTLNLTLTFIFYIFIISLLSNRVFAEDVTTDIKINGTDGPVTVQEGDNINVTVALGPGNHAGENADYWVFTTTPFGTYWYTLNSGWRRSNTPIRVYGGPLFNLSSYTVLDISNLPLGEYVFNFVVDGNMDNIQDNTYADSVTATVVSTGVGSNFTISGNIAVSQSSAVDSDVNDINAPYESNDSFNEAQGIPNPVTLGGYVNVASSGPVGRSQIIGDPNDVYRVSMAANESIILNIGAPLNGDLDLYLYDSNRSLVDVSGSAGATESLIVPENGTYYVQVYACGANFGDFCASTGNTSYSNYTLTIGLQQLSTDVSGNLRLSDDFVPGDLVVRFKDTVLPSKGININTLSVRAQSVGMLSKGGATGRAMLLGIGDREQTFRNMGLTQSGPAACRQVSDSEMQLKLDTIRVIKALRRRVDVEYAEPNYIMKSFKAPNDELYSYQWHYPIINLPQAWDITTGSDNVIVAVIDTGVLLDHPDLQGQLVAGYDFINDLSNSLDGDGLDNNADDPGDQAQPDGGSSFHGTHVSGTIAGATNNTTGVAGAAWEAKIMPLRALGKIGGTSYDIIQAVRYAAGLSNDSGTVPDQRADIINLSLGGSGQSQASQDAFTQARNAGVIIIAASGNENTSRLFFPASYDGVVSVGAIDIHKNRAPYSNYGTTLDVVAPGGNTGADDNGDGYPDGVLSPLGNDSQETIQFVYGFYQGTSMAAPHMAGVVALMKAVYSGLTPNELDALLADGSITNDIGDAGWDDKFGYGLIDAYKAVVAAQQLSGGGTTPSNPTLVATPTSLNFGSSTNTMTVNTVNGGGGTLTISNVSDDASWLSVTSASVDQNNLGSYTATVSRTDLAAGTYTATITIQSSVNTVTVSIIMQVVSGELTGDAGFQYILLIDPDTYESVGEEMVQINEGSYGYSFTNVQSGTYYIFTGSDLNNDGYICDPGEACGSYITLDQTAPVTVNSDLSNLNFSTSFKINIGLSSAFAGERDEKWRGFSRIK